MSRQSSNNHKVLYPAIFRKPNSKKRLLEALELNELWAAAYERNLVVRALRKYLGEAGA